MANQGTRVSFLSREGLFRLALASGLLASAVVAGTASFERWVAPRLEDSPWWSSLNFGYLWYLTIAYKSACLAAMFFAASFIWCLVTPYPITIRLFLRGGLIFAAYFGAFFILMSGPKGCAVDASGRSQYVSKFCLARLVRVPGDLSIHAQHATWLNVVFLPAERMVWATESRRLREWQQQNRDAEPTGRPLAG